MPTATASPTESLFEESAKRAQEFNERLVEVSRKSTSGCVDAYEKSYKGIADYEQKLAETSQIDWLGTLLTTQAELIREVGKVTTASARALLK